MTKQTKTPVKAAKTDDTEQKLDQLKDKSAPEGALIDTESLKDTNTESSKEESTEQNTESTEEVKGSETHTEITVEYVSTEEVEYTVSDQLFAQSNPKQAVTDYTSSLSSIVKNHHTNPETFSKTSDYNTLMHKIERLKQEVLKFIN